MAGYREAIVVATLVGATARLGALTIAAAIASLAGSRLELVAYTAALAVAEVAGRSVERGLEQTVGAAAKPRAAEARLRVALRGLRPLILIAIATYLATLASYVGQAGLAWLPASATITIAATVRAGIGYALLLTGLHAAAFRAAVGTPAVALLLALLAPSWPLAAAATGYVVSAIIAWAHLWAAGLTKSPTGRLPIGRPEPASLLSMTRLVVAALLALYGVQAAVYTAMLADFGVRLGHLAVPRMGRTGLALAFLGLLPCILDPGPLCLGFSLALGAAGVVGVGFQPPSRGVLAA